MSTTINSNPNQPLLGNSKPSIFSVIGKKLISFIRSFPWASAAIVLCCSTLLAFCIWFQIDSSTNSGPQLTDTAFQSHSPDEYILLSCTNARFEANNILSRKTSTLFLVMSLPVSMYLLFVIVSIILKHFTTIPKSGLLLMDVSRPPLDTITSVPGLIQDQPRIPGGIMTSLLLLLILMYVPYCLFAGYYLNTQLSYHSIVPFESSSDFATTTDFVVRIYVMGKNQTFCSCTQNDTIPYCFAGIPDKLQSKENLMINTNKKCIVDKSMVTLSWTEYLTHNLFSSNWWHSYLPSELQFFDTNHDTNYFTVIIPYYASEGWSVEVDFGLNNHLMKGETNKDVFKSQDPTLLTSFPHQNKCSSYNLPNIGGDYVHTTLSQKYTLSCTQTWHDFITGAYHYDSEYNAVSFDPDQQDARESNYSPYNISAFAIYREDPEMPVDAECVSQSRSAFMIGFNIFAFVGSMVGIHAFFRTVLMWSEPLKEKCTKLCV